MYPTTFVWLVFSASFPMATSGGSIGCGMQVFKPKKLTRIIGGDEAEGHSWPWQVMLTVEKDDGGSALCGGSLVRATDRVDESDIVVTAAHCVTTDKQKTLYYPIAKEPGQIMITAGGHDREGFAPGEQFLRGSEIRVHAGYDTDLHHDVAVLKLNRPLNFTDRIRPICLPEEDEELPIGKTCVAVGWGRTSGDDHEVSPLLKQLVVPFHDPSTCIENEYGGWGDEFVEGQMVCAGPLEGGEGVCTGDSGGVLACQHEENGPFTLYGATSFVAGDKCLEPGKPGVFANIINYVGWIKEQIRNMTSLPVASYELGIGGVFAALRPKPHAEPPVVPLKAA